MKKYLREGLKLESHSKRSIFISITMITCAMIAIMLGFIFFEKQLNIMFEKDSEVYINEIAQRSADSIHEKIKGDLDMLRGMAIMLENMDTVDPNYWVTVLKDEKLFSEFQRIGILLPNGEGYGLDVSENFSDREYFKRAMDGQTYISDVLIDKTTNMPSIIYATPIYKDNQVIAILTTLTYTDTYKKILNHSTFGGNGHSYIIDNLGNVILRNDFPDSSIGTNNIFDPMQNSNNSEVDEMKRNMLLNKSGKISYSDLGQEKNIAYIPLGLNHWYTLTVIPDEVVKQKAKAIEFMTLILSGFITIVFTGFLGYIIYRQEKYNKTLLKFAYVDDLTGFSNENYFKLLGARLLTRANVQYAFVLLDIDKFKIVNDLFGYSIGDDVIKHAATVISDYLDDEEIFGHITGDKFYLLLKYTSRDELKDRVDKIMELISDYKFLLDKSYRMVIYAGIYVIENPGMTIDAMSDRAK